jgi:hypothetical protein
MKVAHVATATSRATSIGNVLEYVGVIAERPPTGILYKRERLSRTGV